MVADLTKHLFTLGPEAIEEIAAILQVTVAPSTTTQSTAQSKFLKAYENADAITKSLFNRGIARTDPSGASNCKETPLSNKSDVSRPHKTSSVAFSTS